MAFKRPYMCDVCGIAFIHTHVRRDEPAPDCPTCALLARHDSEREAQDNVARFQRMIESGIAPGVRTNVSRAVEHTQMIMEELGHTDFKDNTREGESIVKGPAPIQTAERDQMVQEIKQYQEQVTSPSPIMLKPQDMAAQIKNAWQPAGAPMPAGSNTAASAAKAMGAEPIAMIDQARMKPLNENFKIEARAKKE